jgi:hypothetical protein
MMDTGERLTSFLKQASGNRRFRQSHLSLYSAILMCHANASSQNPFRVSRRELMKHSAIQSFATYHKCIKDLVENRLILYEPSYHPSLASQVSLLNSKQNNEG